MEQVQNSLLIMDRLMRNVSVRNTIIIKNRIFKYDILDDEGANHFLSLFIMSIIEAKAFFDEYDKCFGVITEHKYNKRIKRFKESIKPLIDPFRKWNLDKMRNEYAAHNMRRKGNEFILSKIDLKGLNAPRDFQDLLLIGNLFNYIIQALHLEFGSEFQEGAQNFKERFHREADTTGIKYKTVDEISLITAEAIKATNNNFLAASKNYRLQIGDVIDITQYV